MAFEKKFFFFPPDFGFMRDFVFVFLVCRGLRVIFGLCVAVGGGVASGLFSSHGRWGVSPSPQERGQSARSGIQGDSAPTGAGGLARNPAWDGPPSAWFECQTCVERTRHSVVQTAGSGQVSTVCLVVWGRPHACLVSVSLCSWKRDWAERKVKGTLPTLLSLSHYFFCPEGTRSLSYCAQSG